MNYNLLDFLLACGSVIYDELFLLVQTLCCSGLGCGVLSCCISAVNGWACEDTPDVSINEKKRNAEIHLNIIEYTCQLNVKALHYFEKQLKCLLILFKVFLPNLSIVVLQY